jgi:hypothetical protein
MANNNVQKNYFLFTWLKSFVFLFIGLGISAFLLFYGVKLINGDNPYYTVLQIEFFRGYHFHEIDDNPTPYLLTIVLISSFIGAFWTTFVASKYRRFFMVKILVLPWLCLIVTSPIFGFIWSYNHWTPQYFVDHFNNPSDVMWLFYKTDAMTGLNSGWLSALQSFPINILSYVAICSLLFLSSRLFSKNKDDKKSVTN